MGLGPRQRLGLLLWAAGMCVMIAEYCGLMKTHYSCIVCGHFAVGVGVNYLIF